MSDSSDQPKEQKVKKKLGRPPKPIDPNAPPKVKKKLGRKATIIDWKVFDKLCAIHASITEIAAVFEVSAETIERAVKREFGCTFGEKYWEKAAHGKTSLRRSMWKKALERNDNTMMIWLSKNHLGMQDKQEQTIVQTKPTEVKVVWQTAEVSEKKEETSLESLIKKNPDDYYD